ncbi:MULTISPECIES: alpha/beta hydrolase-fold protein [Streptomyces]|uniref:Alpha/beta hydrolase-fold protein n=1 Tax=Streptomyces luteosporeus TaxID=173856 RepID=A0ABN3TUI9_9ACTN
MGLTSSTLLLCTVVCTVLMFAFTVWLWPRLGGRTWRHVLGRVAVLVLGQALLFSSVALAANRNFLIYDSWADLAGTKPPVKAAPAGGTAVQVLGRQAPEVPGGSKPRVGGVVEKVVVHGERSRSAAQAYVYLPPEYFQKGNEQRRFPAAVVLTGYPGAAENLVKGLRYPKTAWTQAKQKRMQPMILVMMRPTISAANTQCIDVPGGPQSETFFGTDVVKAVASTYRTGASPHGWAIVGDSTGGYCALKMALQHPETYAAGVGLSADYKPEIDADSGDLFHGNKKEEKRSDLLWSLDHLPQGKTSFLVTTSRQGESNYRPTQQFIKKVKHPARVSSITLDRGGHNFNTWRREIPPALRWLSGRLSVDGHQPPAPTAPVRR